MPLDELRGWLAVLQGEDDQAIAHFEKGLAALKKETGKRKVFFRDLSGLFYLLALIRSGMPQQLQSAADLGEWVFKQRNHPQQFVIWMLYQYAEVKLGKNRAKYELEQLCNREQNLGPISQLFHSLIGQWLPETVATPHLKAVRADPGSGDNSRIPLDCRGGGLSDATLQPGWQGSDRRRPAAVC